MKMGIALIIAASVLLTACEDSDVAPEIPTSGTVSGSITYRDRMALTDHAVVEISLQDVSIADAPAQLIAQLEIVDPGQVPIRFELSYPLADIDQRRMYAIQAKITDRNQLQFISDTHTKVLTRGGGNKVSMTLNKAEPPKVVETTSASDSQGIELEGMFRYMADAALFRDCRTNTAFPVSMEAGYKELERAYLDSGVEPGNELMIQLTGRYLERESMEGNRNEVKLIVDKLNKVSPDETCEPSLHADLQNTYWKLIEIDGSAVTLSDRQREPHLILASAESKAHGLAGCNKFFGTFETDGEALSFSPIGATRMACEFGMDVEQLFLHALSQTTRASISGQVMSLYADDQLLARFEAVYLQ